MNKTNRIIAFIDGFNLYHSMAENKGLEKYKWLNLRKLMECFTSSQDDLKDVLYFTAYATWKPQRAARHRIYVRALELKRVTPVFGVFKTRDKRCPKCKQTYQRHEEKTTDVGIAVKLFQMAHNDFFDTAFIVSGDSDLIPAIQAVKESFPAKKIKLVIPPHRGAEQMKSMCDGHFKIKEKHLQSSLLEDPLTANGLVLSCPPEWK